MRKIRIDDVVAEGNLPSPPEVAHRLRILAQDSRTDVAELAAAVKADPAMCAKVIKKANSPFFGRQFKVNSIQAAIPVLGSTRLRTLVIGFSHPQQEDWQQHEDAYRKVWQRTIHQAVAAEQLAGRLPNADANFYFACGLVLDVGSLAMLKARPHEYSESILFKHGMQQLESAEKKWVGYSHIDVSVALCKKWRFAREAIFSIRRHHEPLCLLRSQLQRASKLTEALKLASHCTYYIEANSDAYCDEFLASLSRVFQIKPTETKAFIANLEDRAGEITSQFSNGRDDLPALPGIIEKAKTDIDEVAIEGHLELPKTKHQK